MTPHTTPDRTNRQQTGEQPTTVTSTEKGSEVMYDVKRLLKVMDEELNRFEDTNLKKAWTMAEQRCPPQLVNDDHKLLFLRVEEYHVELACLRLLRYWSMRLDLFGEEKAFERITLDQSLKEDRVAVDISGMKIMGKYDDYGRGIYFDEEPNHAMNCRGKTKYVMQRSLIRTFWYTMECALEDENIRQNGLISISDARHWRLLDFDREQVRLMCNVVKCMPVRFEAMHICHSSWIIRLVAAFAVRPKLGVLVVAPTYHHTTKSRRTLLQRFERHGIPSSSVPVELGGTAVLSYEEWLEGRRQLEARRCGN